MTTQEPRTGVQVEPLSEEEEREFRGEIEALRRPDYDSFKGRVGRLLATLDATRDEIAAAYRAGRESARRRRPIDRDALARALYAVSQRHDWEHTTDREDRTEEIAAEYDAMTLDGSPLASKSGSETVPVVREGLDEAWAAAEAAVAAAGDSFQVHGYEEPEWRGLFTIESRHTDPNAVSAMAGGPGFITEPVRIFRKPLIEGLHELAAFYVARLNEDARHGK